MSEKSKEPAKIKEAEKSKVAQKSNKFNFNELNTLAVVSLASAVSLFGAPAAVISGHVALQQLKTSGEKGRWMALVGVVLGYVGIASALLSLVLGVFLRFRYGHDFGCMHMYDSICWDDQISYRPEPMPDFDMGPGMNR
jgi:hypothetical protein